jgi:hypothetical protein
MVVQEVDPWVSDEEIKSGERWNNTIAQALDGIDFGIICLTLANQHAPWLMFEGGALAKRLNTARVVPVCIDLAPSDITGPLEAFQGRFLDKAGLRRLVHDINEMSAKPMLRGSLDRLFERMWDDFETARSLAMQGSPKPERSHRSVDNMMVELVNRLRRIDHTLARIDTEYVIPADVRESDDLEGERTLMGNIEPVE